VSRFVENLGTIDESPIDSQLKYTPVRTNRPGIRRIRHPERGRDEIWRLLLEQPHCVFDSLCWRNVLLKTKNSFLNSARNLRMPGSNIFENNLFTSK